MSGAASWVQWKAGYMEYTPNNAAFAMNPSNDISVNYFSALHVKLYTEAVTRFKLAVQDAEEWTPSRGWGGGGKAYDAWFSDIESGIKTSFDQLLA
jgi:hypothetical protein